MIYCVVVPVSTPKRETGNHHTGRWVALSAPIASPVFKQNWFPSGFDGNKETAAIRNDPSRPRTGGIRYSAEKFFPHVQYASTFILQF